MADSAQKRTDRLTVVGIALVGVAVAGFSASSLFTTATEAGVSPKMAWVLPVATDLSALICTRVWLSPRYGAGIRRYAAFLALVDMLLSFLGAALHLVISQPLAHSVTDQAPVVLRLAVGGLPSLTLAAMVHLGALIAAERAGKSAATTAPTARRPVKNDTAKTTVKRNDAAKASPVVTAPPVDAPEVPHQPHPEAATPIPSGASASIRPSDNVVAIASGGSRKARMLAYLDVNPDTTGAELDKKFGTRNYGRGIRRTWEDRRKEASGQ